VLGQVELSQSLQAQQRTLAALVEQVLKFVPSSTAAQLVEKSLVYGGAQ
jgi:hypothetical protein